jgi:hypothetical protein
MPTNDVILAFLAQYGLGVTLLAAFAAAFVFLWKFWPKLVAFVNSVEVVRNLPTHLTEIKDQIEASGKDKSTQINALRESLDSTVLRYDAMAKVSTDERNELRRMAIDSLEERAEMREAIREIRHEVKPNGGSSMKDSLSRLERQVDDMQKLIAQAGTSPVAVNVTNHNP